MMRASFRRGLVVRVSGVAFAAALFLGCAKGSSTFISRTEDASVAENYVSTCGNGVIDPTEECDGDFLHGDDCESLGMGAGMLACDPVTCSFDTSMCAGMPVGTGGADGAGSSGGTSGGPQ